MRAYQRLTLFLFHTGSIKREDFRDAIGVEVSFYSILVRLKGENSPQKFQQQ